MVDRISKLLHSENSVRAASYILIFTLALSNVLGLARDHLLARYIETTSLDIYFASFRIPDLIFNFLVLGAISSALVPVFSDFKAKGELSTGWYVVNSLINIAVLAMIVSAVLVYIFMPYLVHLVVPDFSSDKMKQTVELSRILMLTPIFFSISYIISGVLNSFNRFMVYSFAPLIYNISIITGIVLTAKNYGVKGVAYFVVIGSFLHLLIQVPSIYKLGFRYQLIVDFKNRSVRKIFMLMLPRTIGLGVNQILLLVYTSIASYLTAGSIAAFNFANNIQTVPTVVFGSSMATAIFPTLTLAVSKSEHEKFCRYLNKTIRTISYILIPLSLGMFLLRAQIVRLILGSGYFAWNDTSATAATLGYFSLSLLPQGLIPLFARAFYAVKDTKTPMYAGIISAIIGITAAVIMAPIYSVSGLAIAYGVSSYLNAAILYLSMLKISCYKTDKNIIIALSKIICISLIMAIFLQYSKHRFDDLVNMNTFKGVFTQTLLSALVAIVIYIILSRVLKMQELKWVLKRRK